jgi:hypothetical protein
MIREFFQTGLNILNYATRQCADYLTRVDYEGRTIVREVKTESEIRSLFMAFRADIKHALDKYETSRSEIDSILNLFNDEFVKLLRSKDYYIECTRYRRLNLDPTPSVFATQSLRLRKLDELLRSLYLDLTDVSYIKANRPQLVEPTGTAQTVEEINVRERINSFGRQVNGLYGLI